jgi:rhamnosyltransferase
VLVPIDRPHDVLVVIPSRRGGSLLERAARAIADQDFAFPFALQLVDSGSDESELIRLREIGASVHSIPPESFDHGRTRDVGAERGGGEVIAFLNQDAVPVTSDWMRRLVRPLVEDSRVAAVQGGIAEFEPEVLAEEGRRRFYWDSCGPRFYFTSESRRWIERHGGIGLSTVNCAMSRRAWLEQPFGFCAILEDKKWQAGAVARGWPMAYAPDALVWHSHDYDVAALWRRCVSEGFGWRLVGEQYTSGAALADLRRRSLWRELRTARSRGIELTAAEWFFPLLRPLALWYGNRFARRLRL